MKNYIPKHKSDLRAVERLKARAFETVKADALELLKCLQDMHWQISHPVAEYLLPHVNEITDEILYIFSTNDDLWKLGVTSLLLEQTSGEFAPQLVPVLKRIAYHPTDDETEVNLDETAKKIIINKQLQD